MAVYPKYVRGSKVLDRLVNSPHLKNPKKARQNAVSRTKSSYRPKKPDLRKLRILLKISAVIGNLGLTTLFCDFFTAFRSLQTQEWLAIYKTAWILKTCLDIRKPNAC